MRNDSLAELSDASGSPGKSLEGTLKATTSPLFKFSDATVSTLAFFIASVAEGNTSYYVTGRYLSTGLGLESPTPGLNAIHDYSQQGRLFGYTSTLLDSTSRIVTIAGFGQTQYQIPNNPGQSPNAGGFTSTTPCPPGTAGAGGPSGLAC
jgi:hypothetical protein